MIHVSNTVVLFCVWDPRKSSFCQVQKLMGILNKHKHKHEQTADDWDVDMSVYYDKGIPSLVYLD